MRLNGAFGPIPAISTCADWQVYGQKKRRLDVRAVVGSDHSPFLHGPASPYASGTRFCSWRVRGSLHCRLSRKVTSARRLSATLQPNLSLTYRDFRDFRRGSKRVDISRRLPHHSSSSIHGEKCGKSPDTVSVYVAVRFSRNDITPSFASAMPPRARTRRLSRR